MRQRRDPVSNLRVKTEHEVGDDGRIEGRVQAFHRGRAVGDLTYHVNESYFPERTLYPDSLTVDEDHRGKGVATALHGAALKEHPDLPMTHTVDGMSHDAQRMLPRLQAAHPGRHHVFDEATRMYREQFR